MPRSFSLLATLGEGAFGAVHLAEVRDDDGFVQTLAVKRLHARWSADTELAGRLRDEARLMALLQHDNIVRVHGLTRIDGRLAVLMEPVYGADLSWFDGVAIPPRAAIEIVGAAADALDAAWQTIPPGQHQPLRVVHRDVKPSNIMVTQRGGVKVMDFGVARATFEAREAQTRSQQFGTARYMAPERWMDGVAEAPSDVYALGITLIEIVTGKNLERPRLTRASYDEDLGHALRDLDAWPGMRALAAEMCAYVPAERPAAREVARRCRELAPSLPGAGLRDWAEEAVPEDRLAPVAEGEVMREDANADTFATTSTVAVPARRRPVAWMPIAGAAVAAVALVWFAAGTREAPAPEPAPVVVAPATAPPPTDPLPEPVIVRVVAPPPQPEVVPEPPPPDPEPRVRPRPAPQPVPEPEPLPEPVAQTTPITFVFGRGVTLRSSQLGTLTSRRAVELAHGVHEFTVIDGDVTFPCTIVVDAAAATYRVDTGSRSCTR